MPSSAVFCLGILNGMSLFYITGISGSGKSAVRKELLRRGYAAYGIDEDGLSFFYHNETGEATPSNLTAAERTPEWRALHTWKVSSARVKELAQTAENRSVFLCGTAANDNEAWDLFANIIADIYS